MAAHFLCLTAGGGIPLLCKTRGDLKPLPFAVTGSLNGVHMFAGTHGVKLQTTCTPDSKILWKTYQESISLILVTQDDGASDTHLERLMDYVFQSMVLLYGLDNISNIKNVERFKREIKICNKLVDSVLDLLQEPNFAQLTHSVEVITGTENMILQTYLDTFCEAATSPYGCLFVSGRVAVATPKWWELAAVELVLLGMLTNSLPRCSSRDIPVFLPVTSADVPHRLMTFHLVQGIEVCVLCGPTPSLTELEREVDRFWRTSLDSLKSIVRNHPRIIPSNMTLDHNIQGILLVNTEVHRCLCTVQPHSHDIKTKTVNSSEAKRRKEILQAFYKQVIGKLWPQNSPTLKCITNKDSVVGEDKDYVNNGDLHENMVHKMTDTYIVTETHKCYAMENGARQIFVLFTATVPTYAMRSVTQKTLQTLVKEKCVPL